jgi:hypothetical protein
MTGGVLSSVQREEIVMNQEIYWAPEHAYRVAMYLVSLLQVPVTLTEGDDGEFIITWTDPEPKQ